MTRSSSLYKLLLWWGYFGDSGTPSLVYVDIPDAPSFSSPATVTDSVGNSLESGEITGNAADILLAQNAVAGAFNNRLRPNGISNRRFKSASGRIMIGGNNVTTGQQSIAPLNGSDNLKYYHIGIKGNDNPAVTGISGFNHLASAGGTTVELHDAVIRNTSFACIQINQSTDGVKYASIVIRHVRGFGFLPTDPEGEWFYIGSTNKAANRSKIEILDISHCFGYNKYRDGLQITWAKDMRVTNVTVVDCGIGGLNGQNNLFQIHNSNGYINNSIFFCSAGKTAKPGEIFAQGVTFENGYIGWAVNEPIYIGDLESSDFGPNGSNEYATRDPIIFDGYVFAPSVTVDYLLEIRERNANIIFRNCIFSSNGTSVYNDQRGVTPGNTITIEPSCITVAPSAIPDPTFTNFDADQDTTHGLVTSSYHYNRGLGYRTPEAS
jgi:hypothetical protein